MTVTKHDSGPRAARADVKTVSPAHAHGGGPIEPVGLAEAPLKLAEAPLKLAEAPVNLAEASVELGEAERLISDLAALVDAGLIVVRPNVLGPARYEVAA